MCKPNRDGVLASRSLVWQEMVEVPRTPPSSHSLPPRRWLTGDTNVCPAVSFLPVKTSWWCLSKIHDDYLAAGSWGESRKPRKRCLCLLSSLVGIVATTVRLEIACISPHQSAPHEVWSARQQAPLRPNLPNVRRGLSPSCTQGCGGWVSE